MSTFCPAFTAPASRTAVRAVCPETGRAAAFVNEMLLGLIARDVSGNSANPPRREVNTISPKTASPTLSVLTLLPIATTLPATSVPAIESGGGARRPPSAIRITQGMPAAIRGVPA
jgi:hypothetical protein